MLSRQGHRLLQIGVTLFLLTSFEGFAIPSFAAPRPALSAHSLMALLGVLLVAWDYYGQDCILESPPRDSRFGC
jgi:hypothetical protein